MPAGSSNQGQDSKRRNSGSPPASKNGQNNISIGSNAHETSGTGLMNGSSAKNGPPKMNGIKNMHLNTKPKLSIKDFGAEGLGLDSPGGSGDELHKDGMFTDRNKDKSSTKKGVNPFKKKWETVTKKKEDEVKAMTLDELLEMKHTLPGQFYKNSVQYQGVVAEEDYPETKFDSQDFAKRLRFEELKKTRLEAMCQWKKKDIIGLKKNTYIKEIQKKNEKILAITEKDDLEQLEVQTDRFPLLGCRKAIRRMFILSEMFCYNIATSSWFGTLTICVILVNSILMTLEDTSAETPDPTLELIDVYFTVFYTLEMTIKIVGGGLFFGRDPYVSDYSNWLDGTVVLTSLANFFTAVENDPNAKKQEVGEPPADAGLDIKALRVFRVLRPLRAVSSIRGLKILVSAVLNAIPMLGNTLVVLLFFFIMLAIAGQQLLSGSLMKRCVGIQDGKPDYDTLCGFSECNGGYFCGKTNQNPNGGVTNFDNMFYAFLNVFQVVTLEGWSDIQMMVWEVASPVYFLYFSLCVLVGAFFLINLTLAVINYYFVEAQNAMAAEEQAKNNDGQLGENKDEELENAMNQKDQFSIAQYITAKIYVKKMIEFLRMRKEIKRIEEERLAKLKQKKIESEKAKRTIQGSNLNSPVASDGLGAATNGNGKNLLNGLLNGNGSHKPTEAIAEVEGENEHDAEDGRLKGIQGLIKNSKAQMASQGKNVNDIQIPKVMKEKNGQGYNVAGAPQTGQLGPTMKGIIGRTNVQQLAPNETTAKAKKLFQKLAVDYDIDNIIPKDQQKASPKASQKAISRQESELSLGSHLGKDYDEFSNKGTPKGRGGFGETQSQQNNPQDRMENESGLITSDSDFEVAAQAAGYAHENFAGKSTQQEINVHQTGATGPNLRKDVTKTFKKMLTQNHNRSYGLAGDENDSTRYDGSAMNKGEEFDNRTQVSEIELKFAKKKNNIKNLMQNKMYKEDEGLDQGYLQDQYSRTNGTGGFDKMMKTKKEDIRQLEEFISTKKPKDPFKDMDPLTHKVDIKPEVAYQGTSQGEIFEKRQEKRILEFNLRKNAFMKLPAEHRELLDDPQALEDDFVKQTHDPYMIKLQYQCYPDTSEVDITDDDAPNAVMEEEVDADVGQPWQTATNIGFSKDLSHMKIAEIAKRSDVVITSTLAMSLFPKDKRLISQVHRTNLTAEELMDMVDAKAAFKSLAKQTQHDQFQMRDKDRNFRANYIKSFIHKCRFKTETLQQFKDGIKKLNSNAKPKKEKTEDQKQKEKKKHDQNKRACERRGLPQVDMEVANRILEGKYLNESENEEEDDYTQIQAKKPEDEIAEMEDQFKSQALKILAEEEKNAPQLDEIPDEIRNEFKLPEKMTFFQINFPAIRKNDASMKHKQPRWSGQDVLPEHLDFSKSQVIVDEFGWIRVWPTGLYGLWKRVRFILRLFINGAFFDNFLTTCVLLNTVTMAMETPNPSPEMDNFLQTADLCFTWIFIVEMGIKLIGLGILKYLANPMNWLDGGVVCLSLFEMIFKAVNTGAQGGLGNVKVLRTLRTVRIFRIARLLRSMKSMQVILVVLVSSASSFFYITLLMLIMVFIFALIYMTQYGNKMGETLPKMNFKDIGYAFASTFQILTMENWQTILFDLLGDDRNDKFLVVVFLMLWIFIGNFVILNLFLSILLEAFLVEGEEDEDLEYLMRRKREKQARKKAKKIKAQAKKVIMEGYRQVSMQGQTNTQAMGMFGVKKTRAEEDLEDLEDLDEEEIARIFKKEGVMEKEKNEEQEVKLFEGIVCSSSLYLLSKDNYIRIGCYYLMQNVWWDRIVMVLIVLSSLKLGIDTYVDTPLIPTGSITAQVLEALDLFFNFAFIIEALVKIISMGLIMDPGSYMRDAWNQLDSVIVSFSIVEMSLAATGAGADLSSIRILRMLRILRPLRMISRYPELRMVVVALFGSLGSILNVGVVVSVIFFIFAIFGVSQFGAQFDYCSIDTYALHTQIECELAGGSWETYDHNFDTSTQGFVTLYVVASLEGWPDVFVQAMEKTEKFKGPSAEDPSKDFAIIFFLSFIVIGSFFFLNMFIGVLFLKFENAQAEQKKGYTKQQLDWIEIQEFIEAAEPEFVTTNVPPENSWRKWFHDLVTANSFDNVILLVIVLNMVQMAVEHEGQSFEFSGVLKFAGKIFTVIFIIEAVLKLIAFKLSYFYTFMNRFDFFVVLASILNEVLDIFQIDMAGLGGLAQLARVLRVLRVTRIIKLLGKSKDLLSLMDTIAYSVNALTSVFILLLLFFFIFAIMGWFFFNKVDEGDAIDPNIKNFKTFHNSFLLVFATATGEDWNKVMFDCSRVPPDCVEGKNCGSPMAIPYYLLLVLANTYIMLNLFILVIIQQFEKNYLNKNDSNLEKFNTDLKKFMFVWREFTQLRYNCMCIKESQLEPFFGRLGDLYNDKTSTLGFNDAMEESDQKRIMLKMAIRGDDGYVFFNELLYRCMRRKYGNFKMDAKNQTKELITKYRIFLKIHQLQKEAPELDNRYINDRLVKKNNGYNPFLTKMNFKIAFKTWLKHAKKSLKAAQDGKISGNMDAETLKQVIESMEDEAQGNFHNVDIEVSCYEEYTSDENLDFKLTNHQKKDTMGRSYFGRSIMMSNAKQSQYAGVSLGGSLTKSKKKRNDQLEVLAEKLKERILRESAKKQPPSWSSLKMPHNLRAPIQMTPTLAKSMSFKNGQI